MSDVILPIVDTSSGFVPADDSLKCSRCSNHMVPPIYMCLNGHNSCEDCKHAFPCSICNAPIGIQNYKLEEKTSYACYTCKWCAATKKFTIRTIRAHETTCYHRSYLCPITGCKATFIHIGIAIHLAKTHHVMDYFLSSVRRGYVTHCHQWIMNAHNEIFACYFSTSRNVLKWTVKHRLPHSRVQDFKFQLELFGNVHTLQSNSNTELKFQIRLYPYVRLNAVDSAYTLSVLETSRYLDNIVW